MASVSPRKYQARLAGAFAAAVALVLWGTNALFAEARRLEEIHGYDAVLAERDQMLRDVIMGGEGRRQKALADEALATSVRRALTNALVIQDGALATDKLPKGISPRSLTGTAPDGPEGFGTSGKWRFKKSLLESEGSAFETYVVVAFPLGDASSWEQAAKFALATLPAVAGFFFLAWRFVGRSLEPLQDQMRRLEEFSADVSHELRTPVAIIRSSVELARRTGDWGDAAEEIAQAASRMEKTSSSLLSLATLARAPGDEEEADLRASVVRVAEAVRDAIPGKRLETSAYLAGARASYRVARRQWEICLENLAGNAAKHARTRVTLRLDGGTLEVDDDGEGIAPENLAKVFDRFWQERRGDGYGGYGVGLAIVRKICELRGWEVEAGAAPGGGARFTLRTEPAPRRRR